MSVYNGEKYLERAVASILGQTFRDFEFLIVDDGSTDGSAEILACAARADARIRIITNPKNIGLTRSLNKALAEARGEFVARMDADDVALPERFEKQISFLRVNPKVGVLGTAYEFIDARGSVIGKKTVLASGEQIKRALIRFNPFLHSSVMIRRIILERVGGYNQNYKKAQDYDLWLRLVPHCELANLPEALMQKRFTGDTLSVKSEREQLRYAARARFEAIRRGEYAWGSSIFLIKPFLAAILPASFVRFARIHLFGQSLYAGLRK